MNSRKKIFSGICFISGLVMILFAVHLLFLKGLRQARCYGLDVWNDIFDGTIDDRTAILGSSRAVYQFNCRTIESITQHSCYNLGLDASPVDFQLLRFKKFLEYNRKPETLVMVLGMTDLSEADEIPFPYQYVPYLNDEDIFRKMTSYTPEFIKHRYVPLYSFCIFGKKLNAMAFHSLAGREWRPYNPLQQERVKGFLSIKGSWNRDFDNLRRDHPEGLTIEVSGRQLNDLNEIIEICQKENIKLIFVLPPAYHKVYDFFKNTEAVLGLIKGIASEKNITLLDYSRIPLTLSKEYFYNSQHLNWTGALVFSETFAADLKKILEK